MFEKDLSKNMNSGIEVIWCHYVIVMVFIRVLYRFIQQTGRFARLNPDV